MKRRTFINSSCKACMALAITAVLPGITNTAVAKGRKKIIKLSKQENGTAIVDITVFENTDIRLIRVSDEDFDILVRKEEDNTYTAMAMVCTHARHPLTLTGNKMLCTMHGSKFDETGAVLKGPATKNLKTYPTSLVDETLIIDLN